MCDFVWWIGFFVLCYYPVIFLVKLIKGYLPIFPCPNLKTYGKYACITGATDGIGKAYAFELASRGLDLVLISRNPSRLFDTATEITNKYGVEVKTITADFSKSDIYSKLKEELDELDIGVMVNNVGLGVSFPNFFWEYDPQFINDSININFRSTLMMSRILYPKFLKKKRGVLVNVSSTAAYLPGNVTSIYTSVKHAERQFTSFLIDETAMSHPNIVVQDLVPGLVATKMSQQPEVPFFVLSPEAYSRSAVRTVGRLQVATGSISHEIQVLILSITPKWIVTKIDFALRLNERLTDRLLFKITQPN